MVRRPTNGQTLEPVDTSWNQRWSSIKCVWRNDTRNQHRKLFVQFLMQ